MGEDKHTVEENLISLVKERPHLFLTRHKDYKNKTMRDIAWNAIGIRLGKTSDECRNLWTCLRQQYLAFRRKVNHPNKYPYPAHGRPHFRHENAMNQLFQINRNDIETLLNVPALNGEDGEEEFDEEDTVEKKIFIIDESTLLSTNSSVDPLPSCSNIQDNSMGLPSKKQMKQVLDPIGDFSSEITDEQGEGGSNKEEDEFDLFAKTLALKLRRIHQKCPKICAETELKIHQLLFEAQFSD